MGRPAAFPVFLASLLAAPALCAQGMPPGLDPARIREEIARRVEQLVEEAPEATVEQGHLRITYKEVPCDPMAIARDALPEGAVPGGYDPTPLLGQFGPVVAAELNEHLDAVGTLTTTEDFKLGSKKVKTGSYRVGLLIDEEEALILGLVLSELDEEGEVKAKTKPIKVELKVRQRREEYAGHLVMDVPESEKHKGKFILVVTFFRADTRTKSFAMAAEG